MASCLQPEKRGQSEAKAGIATVIVAVIQVPAKFWIPMKPLILCQVTKDKWSLQSLSWGMTLLLWDIVLPQVLEIAHTEDMVSKLMIPVYHQCHQWEVPPHIMVSVLEVLTHLASIILIMIPSMIIIFHCQKSTTTIIQYLVSSMAIRQPLVTAVTVIPSATKAIMKVLQYTRMPSIFHINSRIETKCILMTKVSNLVSEMYFIIFSLI